MALWSGLKNAATAQIPGLIATAEPQIEAALVQSVSKMPPSRVALISTNLGKLKAAVDKAASMQTASPPAPAPLKTAGKRKKRSKKTRRNKKQ